jgi:4-amino-4-deoxychorismate synthase (2-amino-4-deoxychorismate-forming) component I
MTVIVRELNRPVDLLALHRFRAARYPHLLESTAQDRYDLLFAGPGEKLVLHASGCLAGPYARADGDFLRSLDDWFQASAAEPGHESLPFSGGWFVYLGYELAGQIEPGLCLPCADGVLPDAFATRMPAAVIRDRQTGNIRIVVERDQGGLLEQIVEDIDRLSAWSTAAQTDTTSLAAIEEDEPQRFLDAVGRIHEYIVEGDVFQVNLSRSWNLLLEQTADPAGLYASLRAHNPSPFAGLATWQGAAIISSSPERLVAVRAGIVETRPIAGTRPRSRLAGADRAYSDELLASPKERAEHIMLIDLERNDLGRICVPGTIEVNELMALESYAHVHHIVSNVRGRLRDHVAPGEVLRAMFPGGTITGCPKVRCMEIIAELEQHPRGAYTGSMGYLNRNGNMDMNILIRTMVSHGRELQLRAGAGIVADSDAAAELLETRAKARGLLRALGLQTA